MLQFEQFLLCHNVFKSCLLQRHQKASICGKRLRNKQSAFSSKDPYQNKGVVNPLTAGVNWLTAHLKLSAFTGLKNIYIKKIKMLLYNQHYIEMGREIFFLLPFQYRPFPTFRCIAMPLKQSTA